MEHKLKMELEALPEPETTFDELEAMNRQSKPARRRKRTVVLIAAVLALLLCGMGWAKANMRYGMWMLYASHGWSDVEWITEKYDIQLPETLDGVPFDEYRVYGHVPVGGSSLASSRLRAYLSPVYVPHNVEYAVWETREVTRPDGSDHWLVDTVEDLELSFGTTTNEIWRYYFQIDENGTWTACDVPESYQTIEYKGFTLQIGDTAYYSNTYGRDIYVRWVHWVDEEREVAFSLNENDYTDPNRVVECAKVIIDLNSR